MLQVELVNIGTELLMGFVVNTHASFLGRKLCNIGATLVRQTCVNDTADHIRASLEAALAGSDVVISTGGLGPTSDDITRNVVADMLGLKMRVDARAMENIETRFRRRQVEMPESVRSQALVPEGATVLYNAHGTAPGLAIPISNRRARWLITLPGPPRELNPMFEDQVLPLLVQQFQNQLPISDCRIFRVVGVGESSVEERVESLLKDIPGIEIGYCARSGEVDLRLVIRGEQQNEVHRWAQEAEARARKALGDTIFAVGDTSLERVVVQLLQTQGKLLATAESCTGGHLANRITLVPGSSQVFREGWITYSNHAKAKHLEVPGHLLSEHGAVSEPVARAMSEGALRKAETDYALALTGIAGPDGGTAEKPVGTVFIALSSKHHTEVKHQRLQLDRETFKFAATQTALDMLRKELLKA
jgi:nicotinamide-nucleotide amidase